MDSALATLIAALIAAVAATTNAILTARRTTRLEEKKLLRAAEEEATRWLRAQNDDARRWQTAREDEARAELRRSLANLLERLAACGQEMHWLTWLAAKTPATMQISDVQTYVTEPKRLFPPIVSAHLLVVAQNKEVETAVREMVHRLYALDTTISLSFAHFCTAREESIARLAGDHAAVIEYFDQLHNRAAGILGNLSKRPE